MRQRAFQLIAEVEVALERLTTGLVLSSSNENHTFAVDATQRVDDGSVGG